MLVVETIALIRCEHLVKGKDDHKITRDPKVSRNMVGKVLRSGGISFEQERLVQLRPKRGDGHQNSTACSRSSPVSQPDCRLLRGPPNAGFVVCGAA